MLNPTNIRIHTAGARSGHESYRERCLTVVGAGDGPHVNDVTLAPGATRLLRRPPHVATLFLPLAGEVRAGRVPDTGQRCGPGQALAATAGAAPEAWCVTNAGHALANFLELTVPRPAAGPAGGMIFRDFSGLLAVGGLRCVYRATGLRLFVGLLTGRSEGCLHRAFPGGRLFVQAAAGAVEVEDRLLRERDALTIGPGEAIEFECLTREATLVILETV